MDLKKLANIVTPNTNKVAYEANKEHFSKIAFDVFRLNNSTSDALWILEDGDDGSQYLVAQYEDSETERPIELKSHWLALSDRDSKNVTLMYKDEPIQRFASSEFGFDKDDVHIFQKTLVEKLSSNKDFLDKLIKSQSKEKRDTILKQFPELA